MKTVLSVTTAAALALFSTAAAAEEFTVTSPDIKEGQPMDLLHVYKGFGCEGENQSPALVWSNAPAGTKSFVVTAYDPDAPTGSGWWHWLAFNIPADVTSLDRNAGAEGGMPNGAVQSKNDYGDKFFGGACPPAGKMHRYEFKVYALGVEKLDLSADTNAAVVGYMTKANSLGEAVLTATYTR